MKARLLHTAASLALYFCLATILAQMILGTYVAFAWGLDGTKIVQMLAVLQEADLLELVKKAEARQDELSPEQVSYEQIRKTRAIQVRHLELREQALQAGLGQLAFEQGKLAQERERYRQLKAAFDQQLLELQQGAVATGTDNVRAKLEAIKPQQAKDLLVEMLKNDQLDEVVLLLINMSTTKCAKIMGEFETQEETKQLYEILQRIHEGYPNSDLATVTREQLQQSGPGGP